LKRLIIELLGLEDHIFSSVSASEKSLFSLVVICFMGFFLLSIFSSFFLAFLITGSYLFSFTLGLFLIFVVNFVIRFSLLIIKRPVSKVIEENVVLTETTPIAIPIATPNGSSKLSNLLKKLDVRSIFTSGQVPWFNFTLRIFFSTVFALILIFPLTALFNKSRVNTLLGEKRMELYKENYKSTYTDFKLKVSRQEHQISKANTKLKMISKSAQINSISFKNQLVEIANLKQQLLAIKNEFYSGISNQMELYRSNLNAAYFPIFIFRNCLHLNGFWLIAFVIFTLVFLPQILLVRLKNHPDFNYAKLSNEYYHGIIHGQYQKSKTWAEGYLSSMNNQSKVVLNSKYDDPPYNTKKIKQKRKGISDLEFYNQLKIN
jgi:hypothetical protein